MILVTGAAGFIGHALCLSLLGLGEQVVGIDNLNDYYDPSLKQARLDQLTPSPNFEFIHVDIAQAERVFQIFATHKPSVVVHLAAQAGVRYSIDNPFAYAQSNLVGFLSILEACRQHQVQHLVYASSSSVYGGNTKLPYAIMDAVDHPISLYAATKKSNEVMAHSYSHLYGLATTGLRFFTVYGPWGRPDMAYFKFTEAIWTNKPIPVYNHGKMQRDFTFIDDIITGILRVIPSAPTASTPQNLNPGISWAPYRLYNIGNSKCENLLDFIQILEAKIGKKAILDLQPLQPGDVLSTLADMNDLARDFDYAPNTSLEEGLGHFVAWWRDWRKI